jgi:hypothetical protein
MTDLPVGSRGLVVLTFEDRFGNRADVDGRVEVTTTDTVGLQVVFREQDDGAVDPTAGNSLPWAANHSVFWVENRLPEGKEAEWTAMADGRMGEGERRLETSDVVRSVAMDAAVGTFSYYALEEIPGWTPPEESGGNGGTEPPAEPAPPAG